MQRTTTPSQPPPPAAPARPPRRRCAKPPIRPMWTPSAVLRPTGTRRAASTRRRTARKSPHRHRTPLYEPARMCMARGRRPRSVPPSSMASPTLSFPAATPSNSGHHLPGSRCSSKACLRSAFHCSHSAGSPGETISTRVEGDPHTAHCGAATIPIAMEAIVVSPQTLGVLRSPADCAVLSRSHPPSAALLGQIPRTNRGQTIKKA